MINMTNSTALATKLVREQIARKQAETLLEEKSMALFRANQELHQRAQKLAQKHEQLNIKVTELDESHAQLAQSEKMAAVGMLVASVAHEINNPVGFITSNLEMLADYRKHCLNILSLQEEITSPQLVNEQARITLIQRLESMKKEVDFDYIQEETASLLEDCLLGANRIRSIVADLMSFTHAKDIERQQVNINKLLKRTVKLAFNEIKLQTEIQWDLGELDLIYSSEGRLGQAFLNLLMNAVHSIEHDGLITLSTRMTQEGDQKMAIIEISDNGHGIAEKDLSLIFEPFYTTKEKGKGTGLGLHMVDNVVQNHSGQIEVKSTEGEGSSFRVLLPYKDIKGVNDAKDVRAV